MDGMNPSALKEGLRKKILNAMSGLTAEKLAESSRRLCGRLMELKEFHDSKAIAVYVSLAHEVNTRPIIEEAFRMSKRVC